MKLWLKERALVRRVMFQGAACGQLAIHDTCELEIATCAIHSVDMLCAWGSLIKLPVHILELQVQGAMHNCCALPFFIFHGVSQPSILRGPETNTGPPGPGKGPLNVVCPESVAIPQTLVMVTGSVTDSLLSHGPN